MSFDARSLAPLAMAAILVASHPAAPAFAQQSGAPNLTQPPYADLADLTDSAGLVLHAQVRSMARVDNSRAPGLKPGQGRFYIKAQTKGLLFGKEAIGDSLTYLADLPLDPRGKPPALKKRDVLLFARAVPGKPGEIQLVSPDAQIAWSQPTEDTVRSILTERVAPDAPPAVTGVREAIHVPGNLAGSGETQIFLSTRDSSAASITVRHHPGEPVGWGVSFSELVADTSRPPRRNTLEWYRLACFLPRSLPQGANLSETDASWRQAQADYDLVVRELGPCGRTSG